MPHAEYEADYIAERLAQHRANLRLWQSGVLTPTEPDAQERECIIRELQAAISELETLRAVCDAARERATR